MSANQYLPHLLVIPEDDANRDIVNGFRSHLSVKSRQIQVENVAGGWGKALELFVDAHAEPMRHGRLKARHILILIDLDGRTNRIEEARQKVPADLTDRVFIMGSLQTPEKLAAALGISKEKIGEALTDECLGDRSNVWSDSQLRHNLPELKRMQASICADLLER